MLRIWPNIGVLSTRMWLLTAMVAAFVMFQDRRWKPLEVFDSDEGGYYVYLPSAFIYGDLGRADSLALLQKAQMPPKDRELGLRRQTNGKVISKYWMGTAIGQLPWFWGAHTYAGLTHQPQDGFSRPYQQAVMIAGLTYALLGLWIVRSVLRQYYEDRTVAWAVAGIGLGTNFLVYASYDAAMSHAPLFLWQAALLACTSEWYRCFRLRYALGIGLFLGLAILVRPTEVLYVVVPLGWGLTSMASIRWRLILLWAQGRQVASAILLATVIISLQPLFWYAATGHFLVDGYVEERFNFAHPHLLDGLFSYRKGWLLYTPLAGVALLGLWPLRQRVPAAVAPLLLGVPLVLYVTFSWEQWWYGGGFSARPMVSLYPLLSLPLAALLAMSGRWGTGWRCVSAVLIVLNMWQTYQYASGIIAYDGNTGYLYFHNFFHYALNQ